MQLDCLSHWFPARLLKACNVNIVKRVGEVKQKQQIVAFVLGALFKHSFSFTSFFLKKMKDVSVLLLPWLIEGKLRVCQTNTEKKRNNRKQQPKPTRDKRANTFGHAVIFW